MMGNYNDTNVAFLNSQTATTYAKNATITICHSHTKHLKEITKTADILISAMGSLLGMILGISTALTAGHVLEKEVPISILTILASMFAAVFVGVVSGIVPAIKATKLNPIDALRYQ